MKNLTRIVIVTSAMLMLTFAGHSQHTFKLPNVGIGNANPVSKLEVNGSFGEMTTTVSSAVALDATYGIVLATPATPYTITLPLASNAGLRIYTIVYNGTAGGNIITIQTSGSDNILADANSSTSYSLTGGAVTIQSDGVNWHITVASPPVDGTAGGVFYGTGTGSGFSAAGTAGQVLQSNGTGVPTWVTPTSGTVTSFSAGSSSPLFTTAVATPTSTPALSFTLSNAAAYTILGNNTASAAVPAYFAPVLASALFANQGATTMVLHGNAAGNPAWGKLVNGDITASTIGYGKIQNETQSTLLGNPTGSAASPSEILLGTGFSFSGSTLNYTPATSGTVTSVGLSLPSIFTVTGTPVTSSGTLTATLGSELANTIFAAPNGSAGAPTFRALAIADLPFTGVTANTYGSATTVGQFAVNARGLITSASNVTISGVTPGGVAGGDLSNTYPNPTVAQINGVGLGSTTATAGNLLVASGSQWVSTAMSGDATITSGGVITVKGLQGNAVSATAPTTGQVLGWNGTAWIPATPTAAALGAWSLTGNNGATYAANFIGTTSSNDQGLKIEVDGKTSGRIEDINTANSAYGNTSLGYLALSAATTSYSNVAIGKEALENNTANKNVAVGDSALATNTTGNENTAVGSQSMITNLTGIDNTAIGYAAMQSNTLGNHNIAIGDSALNSSNTGSNNTAIGYNALNNNTSSGGNTAVGASALYRSTTGTGNTAMGYNALTKTLASSNNTAIGALAMSSATTGVDNVAIGSAALQLNVSGKGNVVIGFQAMSNNGGGGDHNVAVGMNSLFSNSGTSNTAIGFNAQYLNITGNRNISLGDSSLYSNLSSNNNTGVGYYSLYNTTSANNTAVGDSSLKTNTTGAYNTALGYDADVASNNLTNATAIGANTVATASNLVVLGNNASVQFSKALMPNGSAGTSGQMLQSNGAGAAPTWVTAFSGTGFTTGTGLSLLGTTLNSYWTLNGSNNLYNNNSGTLVGINTATPVNVLDVNGGAAIGSYAGVSAAPSNSLVVSGSVSSGTATPAADAGLAVNNSHLEAQQTGGSTTAALSGSSCLGTPAKGATVSLSVGNDVAGIIHATTGTAASEVLIATAGVVTFYKIYTTTPIVILTPADATTATIMQTYQIYVTPTMTNFTLNCNTCVTTKLPAAATVNFNYFVIEPQ